jgi:hypothetical protein
MDPEESNSREFRLWRAWWSVVLPSVVRSEIHGLRTTVETQNSEPHPGPVDCLDSGAASFVVCCHLGLRALSQVQGSLHFPSLLLHAGLFTAGWGLTALRSAGNVGFPGFSPFSEELSALRTYPSAWTCATPA